MAFWTDRGQPQLRKEPRPRELDPSASQVSSRTSAVLSPPASPVSTVPLPLEQECVHLRIRFRAVLGALQSALHGRLGSEQFADDGSVPREVA